MGTEPATNPSGDEPATVAEPVASSRSLPSRADASGELPSTTSAASRVTSVVTPRDTLHVQEIARTRMFCVMVVVFSALVITTLAFVGGNSTAKQIFVVSLLALSSGCGWLRWRLRDDENYSIVQTTIVAYVSILGAFTGIWFFSVFSPRSTKSGSMLVPLSCWTAFSSSWLDPSGLASVMLIPYFLLKSRMIVP